MFLFPLRKVHIFLMRPLYHSSCQDSHCNYHVTQIIFVVQPLGLLMLRVRPAFDVCGSLYLHSQEFHLIRHADPVLMWQRRAAGQVTTDLTPRGRR